MNICIYAGGIHCDQIYKLRQLRNAESCTRPASLGPIVPTTAFKDASLLDQLAQQCSAWPMESGHSASSTIPSENRNVANSVSPQYPKATIAILPLPHTELFSVKPSLMELHDQHAWNQCSEQTPETAHVRMKMISPKVTILCPLFKMLLQIRSMLLRHPHQQCSHCSIRLSRFVSECASLQ